MMALATRNNNAFVVTDTYTENGKRQFLIENYAASRWMTEIELSSCIRNNAISVINAEIAGTRIRLNNRNTMKVFKSSKHKFILAISQCIAYNPYNYAILNKCIAALKDKMTDYRRTNNNKNLINHILKVFKGYFSYMRATKYTFWGLKNDRMIKFNKGFVEKTNLIELRRTLLGDIKRINASAVSKFLSDYTAPESYESIIDILISINNIGNNREYQSFIPTIKILIQYLSMAISNIRYLAFGEPMYGQFMIDLAAEYKTYLQSNGTYILNIPRLVNEGERKAKLSECVKFFEKSYTNYRNKIQEKKDELNAVCSSCGEELAALMKSFGGVDNVPSTGFTEEGYRAFLAKNYKELQALYKKLNNAGKVDGKNKSVPRSIVKGVSTIVDICKDIIPSKTMQGLQMASTLTNKCLDVAKEELNTDAYKALEIYEKELGYADKEILIYICDNNYINKEIIPKVKVKEQEKKLRELLVFSRNYTLSMLACLEYYDQMVLVSDNDILANRNGYNKFIHAWLTAYRIVENSADLTKIQCMSDYNIIFWHLVEDMADNLITKHPDKAYYKDIMNVCNKEYNAGFLHQVDSRIPIENYIAIE